MNSVPTGFLSSVKSGSGSDLDLVSYTSGGCDSHMNSLLEIVPGTLVTPDRVDGFVGSLENVFVAVFLCHIMSIRIFVRPLDREGMGALIDNDHLAGNRSGR